MRYQKFYLLPRPHHWSQSDRHASFCVTFRILHQIARVISLHIIPAKRNDYSIVKTILRMNWSLKQSFIYFVISKLDDCFNLLLRWNNCCPQEISRPWGYLCVSSSQAPLRRKSANLWSYFVHFISWCEGELFTKTISYSVACHARSKFKYVGKYSWR